MATSRAVRTASACIAREIEDGLPVLQVGPTIYRGLWLVDGHFLLEVARYLGMDDVADAGVEVLLRRVGPDGSIVQMDDQPHLKETAVALSTIIRQAELTGDLDALRRRWPVVRRAVGFIRSLRDQARQLPVDHPFHGLLPEGFGDGRVGGVRPEYTTLAWTLIGLRYAVQGAAMLGLADDSEQIGKEFLDLRQTFERLADTHRLGLDDGTTYLPMVPPGSGLHQFRAGELGQSVPRWREVQPETATWAICQAIWPGEVFPSGDPMVRDLLALLDRRDDEEGIPATSGWLSWQAVWSYAASFAAHAWLYADRPDKAIDYLYAFANHAAPTRVWREEQPLTGTGNLHICGDMPHNWASAEFIRLVRHCTLLEHGDTLRLLPAVPDHWWDLNDGLVRVEDAPTRFGRIDLTASVREDTLHLTVCRRADPTAADVAAVLHVPAGFGARVTIDGALVVPEEGTVRIMLRPRCERRLELQRFST